VAGRVRVVQCTPVLTLPTTWHRELANAFTIYHKGEPGDQTSRAYERLTRRRNWYKLLTLKSRTNRATNTMWCTHPGPRNDHRGRANQRLKTAPNDRRGNLRCPTSRTLRPPNHDRRTFSGGTAFHDCSIPSSLPRARRVSLRPCGRRGHAANRQGEAQEVFLPARDVPVFGLAAAGCVSLVVLDRALEMSRDRAWSLRFSCLPHECWDGAARIRTISIPRRPTRRGA